MIHHQLCLPVLSKLWHMISHAYHMIWSAVEHEPACPQAAGSSLLAKLTNILASDALRLAGLTDVGACIVIPAATGLALTLTLLELANQHPTKARHVLLNTVSKFRRQASLVETTLFAAQHTHASRCAARALVQCHGCGPVFATHLAVCSALLTWRQVCRHVLWPRVDQKTCLKCITAAGLTPVCIPCQLSGDELSADLQALEAKAAELGHENVLCVLATTSCFAPRAADDVVAIAKFCARTGGALDAATLIVQCMVQMACWRLIMACCPLDGACCVTSRVTAVLYVSGPMLGARSLHSSMGQLMRAAYILPEPLFAG